MIEPIEIIWGDSFWALAYMLANSVDLFATDSPYGYAFMGKEWDIQLPPLRIFRQCYHKLKPGHFFASTMAPRQDVAAEFIMLLKKAGFEIAYTSLEWVYHSGFPKAQNIYKALDKRAFEKWKKENKIKNEDKLEGERLEYDDHSNTGNTRQNPFMSGKNLNKSEKYTNKVPEMESDLKQQWAASLGEDLQTEQYQHPMRQDRSYVTDSNVFSGDRKEDKLKSQNEWGHKEYDTLPIQQPVTEEAKRLEGWYSGYQPKPARELIIIAKKPNTEPSMIDQAVENWGDCVNVRACRIPYEEVEDMLSMFKANPPANVNAQSGSLAWNANPDSTAKTNWEAGEKLKEVKIAALQKLKKKLVGGRLTQEKRWSFGDEKVDGYKQQDIDEVGIPDGRFPANLLVSDDVLNDGIERKTGDVGSYKIKGSWFQSKGSQNTSFHKGDSGSASRYYSMDAWWVKFTHNLPLHVRRTMPLIQVPKPDKFEKNAGLETMVEVKVNDGRETPIDNAFQRGETPRKNSHPTTKPVQLFCYLLQMFAKPGDLVVDPFGGSGTTGIAALICEMEAILIDINEEYCEIMKARIDYWIIRLIKGDWKTNLDHAKKRSKQAKKVVTLQDKHKLLSEFF